MKRYVKLIRDEAEKMGYCPLARAIRVPSTSLHDWATTDKVPHPKSLEKIAAFFHVPMPTLLMEVSSRRNYDDEIVEALYRLSKEQKKQVVEFIKSI